MRLTRPSLVIGAVALLTTACRVASPTSIDALAIEPRATDRLLVFAPHPDDETLAAAGLMQRVRASGAAVHVVMLTSGDAFSEGVKTTQATDRPTPRDFRGYGRLREQETIASLSLLDIDRANVTFLGFPDDGVCLIASKYLSTKVSAPAKNRPLKSPYTGRDEPPSDEQLIRGVAYRGVDIRREIEAILASYKPTLVVMPHPEDRHPEHCGTAIFVREALDAIAKNPGRMPAPRILYYLIHYDPWPNLDEDPASPLQPPSDFPKSGGQWRTLELTKPEAAIKQRAIAAYASQIEIIGRFLRAFARPNELYFEGPVTSAPECWCDDTHVATEIQPEQYRRRPVPRQ
jgi:LmbE family N-acetylglucosaminyl deacetylase